MLVSVLTTWDMQMNSSCFFVPYIWQVRDNMKTHEVWKDGSPNAQLQSTWKGPYPVILSTPTAVKVPGHDSWIHYSRVKPWKKTEEDTQYPCEPLGDLRYLFRTTNECPSNKQPQNLVSGDKISQNRYKGPTQLGKNNTPKPTGDSPSDL